MLIKFFLLGESGGGNLVLKSLRDFGVRYDKVESVEIEYLIPRDFYFKKSLFYKLFIGIIIPFKILSIWFRCKSKNVRFIFSDPLISAFAFLLPKHTRYRYVQADDLNLHATCDGYSDIAVYIFKLLVKFSFFITWEKIIFNSEYSRSCIQGFTGSPIVYPVIDSSEFDVKATLEKAEPNRIVVSGIWRRQVRKRSVDFLRVAESFSYDRSLTFKLFVNENDSKVRPACPENCETVIIASRDDLLAAMRDTDIFIQTSVFEGFGLPSWEALRMGKVVIARESGGLATLPFAGGIHIVYSLQQTKRCLQGVLKRQHSSIRSRYEAERRIKWAKKISPQKEHAKFFNHILGGI